MRRIKGFTLAEVLITLTIIGVIAALTIPSLITNIQDQQYRTVWKRAYSDLTQATSRLLIDNNGSLVNVFQNNSDMVNKYAGYVTGYIKKCNGSNQNCWHDNNNWYNLSNSPMSWGNQPGFILANGDLVIVYLYGSDCTFSAYGIPACGYLGIDTNGFKGPNILGKDIFFAWVLSTGLKPFGVPGDTMVKSCYVGNTGWSCAAQYLRQ